MMCRVVRILPLVVIAAACNGGDKSLCQTGGVDCPAVASVTLQPPTLSLRVGGAGVLTATVDARSGAPTSVTWASSNNAVASVNASGRVTGILPGQATITATSTYDPSKHGSATVSVAIAAVARVVIAPSNATSLRAKETLQLTATTLDDAGNPLTGRPVTWTSSNTAAATVSSTGLVSGVAIGSTQITATSEGQNGVLTLSVTAAAVASVLVSPDKATLGPGGTLQLTATPRDVSGNPLTGRTVTWSSADPLRASVSASGLVTAILPGGAPVAITATADNVSGSAAITVQILAPSVAIDNIFLAGTTNKINPGSVAGSIDVAAHIDNTSSAVNQLDVYIGTTLAGSRVLTGVPAPGPYTVTVNTAQFTVDQAAGVVRVQWPNGATTIHAELRFNAGTTSASSNVAITLANADGFVGIITPPTNLAGAADGAEWRGGPQSPTITRILPAMYSGATVTSVTWRLGSGAPVTQTALPFTASLGAGTTPDYAGYASTPGKPDGLVIVASRVGAAAGPTTFLPGGVPTPILIDYAPPTGGVLALPAAGWVGATYSFATAYTPPTDAGVGLPANRVFAFTYTGCGSTTPNPISSALGADIPECTIDPSGGPNIGPYTVTARESDRLGNTASTTTAKFGLDKTAPATAFGSGTVTNGAVFSAAAPAPAFSLSASDGLAGLASQPVQQTLARASAAVPNGTCVIGTGTPGGSFITSPSCTDASSASLAVSLPTAAGYYTYRWRALDRAGNLSGVLVRTIAVDLAPPVISAIALPGSITGAAIPTFTASFSDDVEGIESTLGLLYPAGPENVAVRYPFVAFGKRFDDAITASGNVAQPIPYAAPFVRRLEMVDPASNGVRNTSSGVYKPTQAASIIWDVTGTSIGSLKSVPIPDATVEAGVPFTTFNTTNLTRAVATWRIIASLGAAPAGLKAQVATPLTAASSPFARVDFYRERTGLSAYCYYGSVTASTKTTNVTNVLWTYVAAAPANNECAPTIAQPAPASGDTFIAVGVTTVGDGLATRPTKAAP
jgi:uncharacterized protein YjdB